MNTPGEFNRQLAHLLHEIRVTARLYRDTYDDAHGYATNEPDTYGINDPTATDALNPYNSIHRQRCNEAAKAITRAHHALRSAQHHLTGNAPYGRTTSP